MVLCFQDVGAIDVVLSCVQSVMLSCVRHINIDCLMYGSVVWVKSFQPEVIPVLIFQDVVVSYV